MKNMLLATILLVSACAAQAQPLINKLMDHVPGDTYTYRKLNSSSPIDTVIQRMGANITWDFTDMIIDTAIYTDSVIAYSNSMAPTGFPGCTYVFEEYTGLQQFFRRSGDTLFYMGNSSGGAFTPNPPSIVYPAGYSASGLNNGPTTTINSGYTWVYTSQYNAYGTLKLPGIDLTDVALYYGEGAVNGTVYAVYQWVRANDKSPLMRLQFIQTGSNRTVQFAYILADALQTGVEELNELDATIYPNPASGTIYIKSGRNVEQVIITDLAGKAVYDAKVNNRTFDIDASAYAKGMYIVKLQDNNGAVTTKHIVIQ